MIYPLEKIVAISKQGSFGAIRKYDIHTGIDLCCAVSSKVMAIEDGIVIGIENFTGKLANSPWWLDTKAVLIESASGVICYGEIKPAINVGNIVKAGNVVGKVKRVLKTNKGFPTSMLHLELYKHGTKETVWWKLNELRPDNLLDPSVLIKAEDESNIFRY